MPGDDLSLAAACTECELVEDSGDPIAAAEFHAKHHDHTGHAVAWTDVELPDTVDPTRSYEVRCLTCLTRHRVGPRDAAEAWAAEHAEYTDPEPDEIRG